MTRSRLNALSAGITVAGYQRATRFVYIGVTALFGLIGIAAAFLVPVHGAWLCPLAVLTTVVVGVVAARWPLRDRFFLLEVGGVLAVGGWIVASMQGVNPVTGFALFLPLAFGIATRRPRWPWALAALIMLLAAPIITGTLVSTPIDGAMTAHLVAVFFLGAQIAVFLGIEVGWAVFARMDAHRADENELAITRERLRFANELHDVQGHTLLAIKLKAELARRSLDRDPATTRSELAQIEQLVQEATVQTRQIANGYRTISLVTELANAGELLSAAGIDTRIGRPVGDLGERELLFATVTRDRKSVV